MKFGPVRLNLSKSGLGISAGVKGARIGIGSTGRAYTHMGRYGFYHRQNLGGGRARATSSSGGGERVEIREDAGATYAATVFSIERPSFRQRFASKEFPVWFAVSLMLAAGVIGWMALPVAESPFSTVRIAILVLAIAAELYLVFVIGVGIRAGRGAQNLKMDLEKIVSDRQKNPVELGHAIKEVLEKAYVSPNQKRNICAITYLEMLAAIVADGVVDDGELARVAAIELTFEFAGDVILEARAAIFNEAYLEAVSDHQLTEGEEASLLEIRTRLGIHREEVAAELEMIDRLSELRKIREGKVLPEVEAAIKLQRGEVCYFKGIGRLLSDKTLRQFQEGGQKYAVRGLVIDKEGDLFITSKRLLLVHSGTSAVQLEKIIDLEIDYDQSLLIITKDGVQKPIYLTTPDPIRAGAILSRVADL